ncbi:MAG TPA: hypothetical protein VGD79_12015 [Thermoanaerobaculia bacterium]|jgi:hypothetical protein
MVGPKLFAGEAASPKRLAVGFKAFEQDAVVAASSIPSVDGTFIGRGARVTASGASGTSAEPHARRAVELVAHFSYFDGAEQKVAPFRAWGCSRVTGCQGSPVGFNVPVDEVQKIVLSVAVERGAPQGTASRRDAMLMGSTEAVELPLVLSLQNEAGAYPLARGFYVVVPMFEGDSAPNWSSWTIRAVQGRFALVDADGKVASFEHFVLRVDYAKLSS